MGRLARAGRADHDGVGLFGAPGVGHTCDRIDVMDARLLARREAHFHDLVEALAGQAFGDLCAEHIAVVGIDDIGKLGGINQHGAALMPLLEDRLAAPLGEVDEPHRDRHRDEQRDEQRAPNGAHQLVPGDDHIWVRGDHADRGPDDFAGGEGEVQNLGVRELHEGPSSGVDPHQDHLDLVLMEQQREDDRKRDAEGEEPHQQRHLRRGEPHHEFVGDELRPAGKIAGVARHVPARGMVLQLARPRPVGPGVRTRHRPPPSALRLR